MDNKDTRDRDLRRDEHDEAEADRAAGDVLGLSRVSPGGTGEIARQDDDGEAHQPPMPDERRHVGARDVTESTTGGTGPDTGGSGVFRRGSGATGTDLGND